MRSIAEILIEMGELKLNVSDENFIRFIHLIDGLNDYERYMMESFISTLNELLCLKRIDI